MMIKSLLMVATLLLAGCKTQSEQPQWPSSPPNLSSSVMIVTMDKGLKYKVSSCSGVHIGDGYVITAAHCLKPKFVLTVRGVELETMWSSVRYDVALARIPAPEALKYKQAKLLCRDFVIGEEVHAITAPKGNEQTHSWGRISGEPKKLGPWKVVQGVNLMADHGSSGGPVYLDMPGADNDEHFVAGIVVSGLTPGGNHTWMVPGPAICGLMARGDGIVQAATR